MTDLEKAVFIYHALLQRYADTVVLLNNAQAESEARRLDLEAAQNEMAPLTPKAVE